MEALPNIKLVANIGKVFRKHEQFSPYLLDSIIFDANGSKKVHMFELFFIHIVNSIRKR